VNERERKEEMCTTTIENEMVRRRRRGRRMKEGIPAQTKE
jgi:hypothetical protein